MQVSVESTGTLERRMRVEFPAARIDQEVSSRLKKVGKTAKISGFRPGKVPPKVVKQRYGQQIRKALEVPFLLTKQLPGQFNIGKGQSGLFALRAFIHKLDECFFYRLKASTPTSMNRPRSFVKPPARPVSLIPIPTLEYPTFQGNANVKFPFMIPVKMLDWEIPLC